MSELAVVSSRRSRLKRMVSRGSRGAAAALRLIDDPSGFLSTVQIGITVIGIGAGAYGGATLGEQWGAWLNTFPLIHPYGEAIGMGLVIMAITYFSLVLGALVPKRLALHNPERIAELVAPPMIVLSKVTAPLVWLLRSSIDTVLRGVMIIRTVRSARRSTPSIISRSWGTNTPTCVPSVKSDFTSSSVTVVSRGVPR